MIEFLFFFCQKMSFDSDEDQYHRFNVQQLKIAYLEQVRRDAQRHAHHRSTPIIGIAGGSRASLGHVTPLLPDIQEAAHEGSSASSVTTQASLVFCYFIHKILANQIILNFKKCLQNCFCDRFSIAPTFLLTIIV